MVDLPPIEKTVQMIPTDAEIKELINALLDEPEHYRYYYFLAIYTGCRRGELCALKWSDFQVINNIPTLVVSRSRSALPYSGVVEKGTKNNKERSIILSQDIYDLVQGYWYFKKMQCEELGIKMSEYLFTDDKGTLIHHDTFSKRLRKIYDSIDFSKEFHRIPYGIIL